MGDIQVSDGKNMTRMTHKKTQTGHRVDEVLPMLEGFCRDVRKCCT